MKNKRKVFFALLLFGSVAAFGAVADSTTYTLWHTAGMHIADFAKANAWTLAAIAFTLVYDDWLANTPTFKNSSILSLIFNWIRKYILGKGETIQYAKASAMTSAQLAKQLETTRKNELKKKQTNKKK